MYIINKEKKINLFFFIIYNKTFNKKWGNIIKKIKKNK